MKSLLFEEEYIDICIRMCMDIGIDIGLIIIMDAAASDSFVFIDASSLD